MSSSMPRLPYDMHHASLMGDNVLKIIFMTAHSFEDFWRGSFLSFHVFLKIVQLFFICMCYTFFYVSVNVSDFFAKIITLQNFGI